jgi:hypothetical protein
MAKSKAILGWNHYSFKRPNDFMGTVKPLFKYLPSRVDCHHWVNVWWSHHVTRSCRSFFFQCIQDPRVIYYLSIDTLGHWGIRRIPFRNNLWNHRWSVTNGMATCSNEDEGRFGGKCSVRLKEIKKCGGKVGF